MLFFQKWKTQIIVIELFIRHEVSKTKVTQICTEIICRPTVNQCALQV